MDIRKTVTDPGPAVVLGAIFENAEFGDKGIDFRLAVGGLGGARRSPGLSW